MDPPDIFEAVTYTRWRCPAGTKRVDRGLILCRDRRSIVARADFYQRVDNLQREETNCAACSRWKKRKKTKLNFSFFFCSQRRYEDIYLRLFFERNIFEEKT